VKGPAGCLLALALASGLAYGQTTGQTTGKASPPAAPVTGSSPWNARTTPPPPRPPADDSVLSLSVYSDLNKKSLPPYQPGPGRLNDPAYAVGVSAVMTHCPDGSLLITGLLIGGQITPLDNRCPAVSGKTPPTPAPACDANRWNCGTAPVN
jgi:hypothetical protein